LKDVVASTKKSPLKGLAVEIWHQFGKTCQQLEFPDSCVKTGALELSGETSIFATLCAKPRLCSTNRRMHSIFFRLAKPHSTNMRELQFALK